MRMKHNYQTRREWEIKIRRINQRSKRVKQRRVKMTNNKIKTKETI